VSTVVNYRLLVSIPSVLLLIWTAFNPVSDYSLVVNIVITVSSFVIAWCLVFPFIKMLLWVLEDE